MLGCTTHGYQFMEAVCAKCRDTALGQSTEIDRLRAHVAAKVQENEEFRSEYGELEVKLENCEAELAEAKARIAELEANGDLAHWKDMANRVGILLSDERARAERAEARVAELEAKK